MQTGQSSGRHTIRLETSLNIYLKLGLFIAQVWSRGSEERSREVGFEKPPRGSCSQWPLSQAIALWTRTWLGKGVRVRRKARRKEQASEGTIARDHCGWGGKGQRLDAPRMNSFVFPLDTTVYIHMGILSKGIGRPEQSK